MSEIVSFKRVENEVDGDWLTFVLIQDKNLVLVYVQDEEEWSHIELADEARDLSIVGDDSDEIGGGILKKVEDGIGYVRDSHAFGGIDTNILEDFIDYLEGRLHD